MSLSHHRVYLSWKFRKISTIFACWLQKFLKASTSIIYSYIKTSICEVTRLVISLRTAYSHILRLEFVNIEGENKRRENEGGLARSLIISSMFQGKTCEDTRNKDPLHVKHARKLYERVSKMPMKLSRSLIMQNNNKMFKEVYFTCFLVCHRLSFPLYLSCVRVIIKYTNRHLLINLSDKI